MTIFKLNIRKPDMSQSLQKGRLKAVSLVEVLAILVLTGVLLLATARMTSSLLIQLRNNEVEDYANGLALQALEAAKSPNNISLTVLPVSSGSSYSIALNPGGVSKLERRVTNQSQLTQLACNTNSIYYVNSAAVTGYGQVPVCIQIIIKSQINPYNNSSYYQILARVIYSIPGKNDSFDLTAYRYAGFNIQP